MPSSCGAGEPDDGAPRIGSARAAVLALARWLLANALAVKHARKGANLERGQAVGKAPPGRKTSPSPERIRPDLSG